MEFIHKFQQDYWHLENKKILKIMRDNIVDYNVIHNMTSTIMNSMQ